VAWSPDSELLATASSDGTTKLWALFEGGGREIVSLTADDTRAGVQDVAFSPDGARIVTAGFGGTALVWQAGVDAGAEVAALPGAAFGAGEVRFTDDGRHLLATAGRGQIAVWDTDGWQRVATLGSHRQPSGPTAFGRPLAGPDDVVLLAPSPDGLLTAAIDEDGVLGVDGTLRVYDVDAGTNGFTIDLGGWVNDAAWSADGHLLAVAGGDHGDATVTITDRDGHIVSTLQFPGTFVETARFTTDADLLVIAHANEFPFEPGSGRVELWDWRHDRVLSSVEADAWYAVPHPTEPLVAISPHAEAIDQTVAITDLTSGQRIVTLAGSTGSIEELVFSRDGTRIATASNDGSIRVWDSASGQQQLTLRGNPARAYSVSFSPDGRWLASYAADGTIRVWALDLDDLADIARHRVTRHLTPAECLSYLRQSGCHQD
jgi:WD40 repeat protein